MGSEPGVCAEEKTTSVTIAQFRVVRSILISRTAVSGLSSGELCNISLALQLRTDIEGRESQP